VSSGYGRVLPGSHPAGAALRKAGCEPIADKVRRLAGQRSEQQAEAAKLDAAIAANLKELGFWEAQP